MGDVVTVNARGLSEKTLVPTRLVTEHGYPNRFNVMSLNGDYIRLKECCNRKVKVLDKNKISCMAHPASYFTRICEDEGELGYE